MSSVTDQIKKGNDALKIFHNASLGFSNYTVEYEELLTIVSKNKPSIFLEGFGFAIESLNDDGWFGNGRVKNAMEDLAARSAGKIPAQDSFFSSLSGEAQNISFIDQAQFVAQETGKKVLDGAVEVGNIATDTLKSVGMFLPLGILIAVGFILYSKTRKLAA